MKETLQRHEYHSMSHILPLPNTLTPSLFPSFLLQTMKETLQRHEYHSMSAVAKDFYTLLNNGCTVTPMGR